MKQTPLPKLLKKAQEVINKYVRERDADEPCISCGLHKEHVDAGHYVPQGSSSFLRYHLWNINKECKGCNSFDKFHLVGYRKRLIEKIGLENVEWLEDNKRNEKRWSRSELMEIIMTYGKKAA